MNRTQLNSKKAFQIRPASRTLAGPLLLLMGLLITGCSTITIQSTPPGGKILWSDSGYDNWQEWPPNGWTIAGDTDQTPFKSIGIYRNAYFITVEQEGYIRPLPQVVQLYAFRNEDLKFELTETPETTARRMRESGFVYYQDEWVDPEVAGVVEYKGEVMPQEVAYTLQMRDKGFVLYEDEWVTPEEAERREVEDNVARGLVQFRGRWVTESQKEEEEKISELVQTFSETEETAELPAPRIVGNIGLRAAQVQLNNSSQQRIQFYFDGPVSRFYELDPYTSLGVSTDSRLIIPEGRYDIAVVPTGLDSLGRDIQKSEQMGLSDDQGEVTTKPQFGSWPLAVGRLYSFTFTGASEALPEDISEFELPDTQLDIVVPEINVPEIERKERPERRGRPGSWP